jgi:transcription elongation factor Elf1
MPADIQIQRFPCPRCHSLRTILTDTTGIMETLCCPDCGHIWDRVVRRR